ALDICEAQRGRKGGETVRMFPAKLGHRVIGNARETKADVGRRDVLDRGVRQGDDLAVVAELVHFFEAGIHVKQLGHAAQALSDVFEVWGGLVHLPEKAVRIDVTIDVDNSLDFIFLLRLFSAPNAAAGVGSANRAGQQSLPKALWVPTASRRWQPRPS